MNRERTDDRMAPPQIDDERHEPLPDDVIELIAYDEQLRQGGASSTRRRSGQQSPGAEPAGSSAAPAELVECLQLIEEVWPRAGQRSQLAASLPTHIGRFEIERVLGSGGFGIVYLARDPLLHRQVALKVPRLHAMATDGLQERFRREARATAALDHPNIVPIHETGEEGPLCYIAFAYCEGPSLAQWHKLQAGDVPPRMAAAVVRQLAEAMHYSHGRGILHRDLKPSNVLLFPLPEDRTKGSDALPFVPRIVDFGLARLVEDELEATGTSAVIGTPLYMAPEQALGKSHEIGPAADLYGLGVMLYELLCRRPPFVGMAPLEVLDQVRQTEPPPIRRLRSDVPRDLETICLKCLQKRPEDRYSSALAMAEDLARFLDGQDVLARPVTALQRCIRWCQQPQRLREAGLTVMAVNIAMGSWTAFTTMVIAQGLVPRPDHLSGTDVYLQMLPIVLLVSPTIVVAGFWIMRGKRWAIRFCLGTGIGMTITAILLSLSLVSNPYAWLWNDLPGFSMAMYSMVAMLCLVQTLASIVASMALSRLRKDAQLTGGSSGMAG
jgi:tRNA A-37 threonylcarbamoyl transferase component Bud32